MIRQVRNIVLTTILMALFVVAASWIGVDSAEAAPQLQSNNSCVIPPSGPWPPCATGGQSSNSNNSCPIPPSGPWPACARSGGGTPSGGGGGQSGSCVIPPSGPWPACARGGGGTPSPSPASSLVELTGTWQASYWPNASFFHEPTWFETINVLSYDWGAGSPQPRIPNDYWSAKYTRTVSFDQPTKVRFVLNADDRVWLKITHNNRALTSFSASAQYGGQKTFDFDMPAGQSTLDVDFIENTGNAHLELRTYVVAQNPQTLTPVVEQFNVPTTVVAGDTASLEWRISGVPNTARLTLVERKNNGVVEQELRRVVEPVGTLNFTTATTSAEKRLVSYRYWLEYEGLQLTDMRTMQTDCTYQWFFLPTNYDYDSDNSRKFTWGQCPTRPDVSQASMQRFDGGLMIWIANRDQILVYNANTNTLDAYTDTFQYNVDPIFPTLPERVPDGKFWPLYGFGKLWTTNLKVQTALGWPTHHAQDYLTVEQSNETDFRNDRGFLRLADGKVMFTGGARGILQTQPRFADINGFAHPNNGLRNATASGCVIPTSGPWPPCATGR